MDFEWAPDAERFRKEVREWLKEELRPGKVDQFRDPTEETGFSADFERAFRKTLAQKGYAGISWPKEYGGQGKGMLYQAMLSYELSYARAPVHAVGTVIVGPAIMLLASEEQKMRFLPRIASGDIEICLGYSEPGSGSDLASLQTSARQDGDDYIVNGQKIFTTWGHKTEYIWLAARTNPDVPKHKGLSIFMLSLKSPGVQIRPLWTIAGWRHNEIFFDNVRVPASDLIGGKDRGWYNIATALTLERTGIGIYGRCQRLIEWMSEYCKTSIRNGEPLSKDPKVRHKLAQIYIDMQVGTRFTKRVALVQEKGQVPNLEAPISKIWGSELLQRIANLGTQMAGLYGPLMPDSPYAPLRGQLAHDYLDNVPRTIAGGANEIQRNIIAQRGLGMPRA